MLERNVILQPLCLGGILAVGAGVVWAVLVGWGTTIGEQFMGADWVNESIQIQLDGTPIISSYTSGNYQDKRYRTLDGQPIEMTSQFRSAPGVSLRGPVQRHRGFSRLIWRNRIIAFYDNARPPNYWYFVHSGERDGTGYFVGYNSKAKLLVGYIGLKGFRPGKPPPEEFFRVDGRKLVSGAFPLSSYYERGRIPWVNETYAMPGYIPSWVVHLLTEDGLLEIDLSTQSVRVVMESAELLSVSTLLCRLPSTDEEDPLASPRYEQLLAVHTPDRVLILDRDGSGHSSYLLPAELRAAGSVTLYQPSDEGAIVHRLPRVRHGTGTSRHDLFWIDHDGNITRHEEVLLQRGPDFDPRSQACLFALAMPAPIALTVAVFTALPWQYLDRGLATDYPSALARSLSDSRPALLITYVLATGLAWVCHRRQKRYAIATSYAWIVFVFLGGVPGLLGYLFHRRWPVREACPACGTKAPRDREACSACSVEFPRPAMKGSEVFAS